MLRQAHALELHDSSALLCTFAASCPRNLACLAAVCRALKSSAEAVPDKLWRPLCESLLSAGEVRLLTPGLLYKEIVRKAVCSRKLLFDAASLIRDASTFQQAQVVSQDAGEVREDSSDAVSVEQFLQDDGEELFGEDDACAPLWAVIALTHCGKTAWSSRRFPLRSLCCYLGNGQGKRDVPVPEGSKTCSALREIMGTLTSPQDTVEYGLEFFCEGDLGLTAMLHMEAGASMYENIIVAGLDAGSGLVEWNAGNPLPKQRVARGDRLVEINGIRNNTSDMWAALRARDRREPVCLRFQRCASTRADEQQISFEVRVWNPDCGGLACFRVMESLSIEAAGGFSLSGSKTLASYRTGAICLQASLKLHDTPGTGLTVSVDINLPCSEERPCGLDGNGDEVVGSSLDLGCNTAILAKIFSYVRWR